MSLQSWRLILDRLFTRMLDQARRAAVSHPASELAAISLIGAAMVIKTLESDQHPNQRMGFPNSRGVQKRQKAMGRQYGAPLPVAIKNIIGAEEFASLDQLIKSIDPATLLAWDDALKTINWDSDGLGISGKWFGRTLDRLPSLLSETVSASPGLAELMVRLLTFSETDSILDPFCGAAQLLATLSSVRGTTDTSRTGQDRVEGLEPDPLKRALGKLRLYLLGERCFEINSPAFGPKLHEQVTSILCIPPAGRRASRSEYWPSWLTSIFYDHTHVSLEVALVAYTLDLLKPGGQAVFLVPSGLLFRSGVEKKLRSELVKSGYIRCVISLPDGSLLPTTSIKAALILLERPRQPACSGPIKFIDASRLGVKSKAATRFLPAEIDSILTAVHGIPSRILNSSDIHRDEVLSGDVNLLPSWHIRHEDKGKDSIEQFRKMSTEITELEAKRRHLTDEIDALIDEIIADKVDGKVPNR